MLQSFEWYDLEEASLRSLTETSYQTCFHFFYVEIEDIRLVVPPCILRSRGYWAGCCVFLFLYEQIAREHRPKEPSHGRGCSRKSLSYSHEELNISLEKNDLEGAVVRTTRPSLYDLAQKQNVLVKLLH